MGLIARYPLFEDGKDVANRFDAVTPNCTFIDSGIVYNKAAYFNGTTAFLKSDYPVFKNTPVNNTTIACWFNLKAYRDCSLGVGLQDDTTTWSHVLQIDNFGYFNLQAVNQSTWAHFKDNSFKFNLDTWYHISLVTTNSKYKLFVNGSLVKEWDILPTIRTVTTNTTFFGAGCDFPGGDEYSNCYLQDIRIYDHCLSDKEIYELSKAKVLHYTFDDVEEPTVNLFPVNNKLMPIRHGTDSSWELYNDSDNNIVYKFNRVNQTLYEYNGFDTVVAIGDKYTLSMDIYISTDYDRNSGILTRFENAISTSFDLDNTKKGIWQRSIITGTCTTTTLRTLLYPSPNSSAGTKGYILYRNPQLEKKDHATPFVNGTRNNIVVRDKSDYGNDSLPLTVSTTPAFVDDCKIGMQSSKLVDFKYLQVNKTNLGLLNKCSISFWRKRTRTGSWLPINSANVGGNYIMATSGGTGSFYHQGAGSAMTIYKNGDISPTPANDDSWNHYVITGLDLSSWSNIFFNAYDSNGTWTNHSIFDDIRIYATALTADDIKEIYQSRANLDDKGNLKVVALKEKQNIGMLIDTAIKNKTFSNGLGAYNQTYCTCSLTNEGYRVFRPPNITRAANGNSMWGGFIANIPEGSFFPGRKYKIKFEMKGKSSKGIKDNRFSYLTGFFNSGLTNEFTSMKADFNIFGSFDISNWGNVEIEINPTLANMYKTALVSEGPIVAGGVYYAYRQLKIGVTYEDTGPLGTDVYIRNFRVYDVTDGDSNTFEVTETGIINLDNISEIGVTEGLIAHYPLNGDARDYSGNGNDGVVYGATVAAGQGQKCYSFDGVDDRIDILNGNFFKSTSFSASCWFYGKDVSNETTTRRILSFTETGGWNIGLDNEGSVSQRLRFQIWDGSSYKYIGILRSEILNEWNYVFVSYDSSSKIASLYINNSLIGSITLSVGLSYSASNIAFRIGNEAAPSATNEAPFKGKIQDIRIYNRALTPEEVLINYNLTKADKTAMIQAENGTTYVGQIKED